MKKLALNKRSSSICLAALLASYATLANVAHAGEFFVGLNAGTATFDRLNDACDDLLDSNSLIGGLPIGCSVRSDSDAALGINAGYNFNRIFGLEAGYVDLGNYSADLTASRVTVSASAEVDYIYAALVLTAPITDRFSASARLGGVNADISLSADLGFAAEFEDETAGFAGISLDYRFADKFSLQVRYDSLSEAEITTAGIRYHF